MDVIERSYAEWPTSGPLGHPPSPFDAFRLTREKSPLGQCVVVTDFEVTFDGEVEAGCVVKLQTGNVEVNVWATPEELRSLRAIRDADWKDRRSLAVGRVAGARAFWCSEGDVATIMVGHDDETWDLAITVPIAVVDQIVARSEAMQ